MKCAAHPQNDAVAQCQCLKGLCLECASIFTPPMCPACATTHNKGVARSFYTTLAMMVLLGISSFVLVMDIVPLKNALICAAFMFFCPPGWQFISRYFSKGEHYHNAHSRWLALAAHFSGAAAFGIVVGPIYLYKAWKDLQIIKNTERMLNERS